MEITNGVLRFSLEGQIIGASDREAFIDKLITMCLEFRDPDNDLAPFERVERREELYHGRLVEKAPDVVFYENPHYYVTRGVPDSTSLPWVQDIWTTTFSAYHRPHGILAISGPRIEHGDGSVRNRLARGGDFNQAHIMDVMPTILALVGERVPAQADGRVLDEALSSTFLATSPVEVGPVPGFLLDRVREKKLTPAEKEALKSIPYIN